MIEVLNGGPLTLIQDGGRHGWQSSGVPVAGALDRESLAVANLLCGNRPDSPGLEAAYGGLSLRFLSPTAVAVAGGHLGPLLNGVAIPALRACAVAAGDELTLSGGLGLRAYIAVAGGLAPDTFLGSAAAYLRGGFPGTTGRPLRAGDKLSLHRSPEAVEIQRLIAAMLPGDFAASLPARRLVAASGNAVPIRVVLGPQADHFAQDGLDHFLRETWRVTRETDRMGCRLDGVPIPGERVKQIISDGAANGSIQVPGNGLPIILLADRQPTGGYPKIATVVSGDLPLLAHCAPETPLRFTALVAEEARTLARDRAAEWRRLTSELAAARADRCWTLSVDGARSIVSVERLD
jgi:biotin-dependent carboxylase-like uncharacterized protein